MLISFVLILLAVAVGDVIAAGLSIPVPGSILGLVAAGMLFALRGGPTRAMSDMFDTLIPYAPMLFVPAGAGVVATADLLSAGWLPIAGAITIATAGTLIATGTAAQILLLRLRPPERRP